MEMLAKKVKKELDAIADKGITSSNLETTYKLIDIYKDIKEICVMKENSHSAKEDELSMGYVFDERIERYFKRIKEGMEEYYEGKDRYKDGGTETKMIDGIEVTMCAIFNFIECLLDKIETSQEKEIVKKYVNKIKNI